MEDEYARGLFTGNMYSVLNTLVRSKVGWEEISVAEQRYQASSRILASVDQIGFIYLDDQLDEENPVCTNTSKTFEPCMTHGMSIQLAKMPTSQIGRIDSCFSFQDDQICVPASVFDEQKVNCTTFVASFISFENGTGHICLYRQYPSIHLFSYPPQAYSLPSLLQSQTSLTSLGSLSTMGPGLKSRTKWIQSEFRSDTQSRR